jgi:hypothetical protein
MIGGAREGKERKREVWESCFFLAVGGKHISDYDDLPLLRREERPSLFLPTPITTPAVATATYRQQSTRSYL